MREQVKTVRACEGTRRPHRLTPYADFLGMFLLLHI